MKKTLLLTSLVMASILATSPAVVVTGNGEGGFGGPIGGGSLTITDDGTDLSFTLTRGSGSFNDTLVIYFDSVTGGASSLGTSGEIGSPFEGRRAIVNEYGSGISGFNTGFQSDYAFALKVNGSTSNHMFTTPSGANANDLGFVATYTITNFGNTAASSYSWTIPVANIGLTANSGATFKFVTTYLNAIDNGDASYRSNEAFGAEEPGGSNVGYSNYSFTTNESYTIVPEPSTLVALVSGLGLMAFRRRR